MFSPIRPLYAGWNTIDRNPAGLLVLKMRICNLISKPENNPSEPFEPLNSCPIDELTAELYGLLGDSGLNDLICVEAVMRLMVYVAKKIEMQSGEWEIACSNMTDAIFEDNEDIREAKLALKEIDEEGSLSFEDMQERLKGVE